MKNIVIFEYFSSNFKLDIIENGRILKEGLNIVNNLIKCLKRCRKLNIFVFRSLNLTFNSLKNVKFLETNENKDWKYYLKKFDSKETELILIAPEKSKVNQRIFVEIKKMNFTILCSSLDVIKIFSSKFETFKKLKQSKIPCIRTTRNISDLKCMNSKIVTKPDKGAGSENIQLISQKERYINKIPTKSQVFQPFIEGIAGSITILCANGKGTILSLNKHIVKQDGKFLKQVGSIVGGLEYYKEELISLSQNICSKFPGLFGFIGIDVINDKRNWKIIEINPRFTSTFCGISRSYGQQADKLIRDFYIYKEKIFFRKLKFIRKTKVLF